MDRPAGKGLASALAEGGLAVANVDFRATARARSRAPSPRTTTSWSTTSPRWSRPRARAFPDLPVAIVGHSLGGHATLLLAGLLPRRAPDALVMLASNLWIRRTDPSALRRAQKWGMLAAWRARADVRRVRRPSVRDGQRRRAARARRSVRHVLPRRPLSGAATAPSTTTSALARARSPCSPSPARATASSRTRPRCARSSDLAPHARATHRVIRHGELGRPAPSHMGLVTEAACRPVWDEIARWLRATLASPNTG